MVSRVRPSEASASEMTVSAVALGTGVAVPLPAMKYQSKPALLASTFQL